MVSYRGKFSRYAAMGGFLRLQPHFACRSFLILRFLNGGGRLYLVYFRPSSLKFELRLQHAIDALVPPQEIIHPERSRSHLAL